MIEAPVLQICFFGRVIEGSPIITVYANDRHIIETALARDHSDGILFRMNQTASFRGGKHIKISVQGGSILLEHTDKKILQNDLIYSRNHNLPDPKTNVKINACALSSNPGIPGECGEYHYCVKSGQVIEFVYMI